MIMSGPTDVMSRRLFVFCRLKLNSTTFALYMALT